MAKAKLTLLDRAKADLKIAKLTIEQGGDDNTVDIAAYLCAQCVEKAVKYVINLQGDECAGRHEVDIYLPDLKNEAMRELVLTIKTRLDRWASQIRYSKTLLSNKESVSEVITVCEKIIKVAESVEPAVVMLPQGESARNL